MDRTLSSTRARQRSLRHSTRESVMKFVFIIAIMFLGITTAQGQTAMQLNGQTNSGDTAVGSNPFSVPPSSLPSVSSPSPASELGTASGSPATTGSASGAPEATRSASGISQSPLLLPGEIPDTSTQAASTTATAPGPPSPICPPPVPSTDGGSANLSEMAGVSLNGC
jgi:cytoskeletal protein RodZ